MFTVNNTEGFTNDEIDLLNEALQVIMAEGGIEESNASDIVNNNWMAAGNTVETLAAH